MPPKRIEKPSPDPAASAETDPHPTLRSHLGFGWWALLGFLALGIVLEALHGFKIGWYLNVSNQTRRLLFTLAHAHGTLLALVNIAFALTVPHLPGWPPARRRVASAALKAATILLPGGFLLGGLVIHDGDPGLGVVLLPLGALLLLVAVYLCATAHRSPRREP